MYIIAGLGNPSLEYKNTRHNIGFDVIDVLADRYGIDVAMEKHKGLMGKGSIEGARCVLVKPQTFMNSSGECIREIVDYYRIDISSELIVVYDDVALDVGSIRVRERGSAGGHNGMKSIISNLSSEDFMRVRMGVGDKPKGYDLADYVLGHFTREERELMDGAVIKAVNALAMMINDGVEKTMSLYNHKVKADE